MEIVNIKMSFTDSEEVTAVQEAIDAVSIATSKLNIISRNFMKKHAEEKEKFQEEIKVIREDLRQEIKAARSELQKEKDELQAEKKQWECEMIEINRKYRFYLETIAARLQQKNS